MKTEKYVSNANGWTASPEEARSFTGATEAFHYCCDHHLACMKILGDFEDSQKNFSISLNAERWTGATAD